MTQPPDEPPRTDADYFALNRAGWDRRAEAHFQSSFYDVDGFLAGNTSLREIELAELPQVQGKRLLHLQCHFGLDTLSLSRRGASCTGVDLSPTAIDKARELAARACLDAEFVCSNVYDYVRSEHTDPFDIVFTTYGVLCWLPDLDRWAKVVAENLSPGGIIYLAEFHPVIDLLSGWGYFGAGTPDVVEEGTYTDGGEAVRTTLATWAHPLSRVLTALIDQGIVVQRVSEYAFSPYDCFDGLVEREPGRFYRQHEGKDAPLVYTITGRKPA
ncbi:MAG: class I SAM-dependent methyltransferase [Pseudomonadota bacterium]